VLGPIASITHNGDGQTTLNFSVTANANYQVTGAVDSRQFNYASKTTTSVMVELRDVSNGALLASGDVSVALFGM
jgi:hypothetical protein